MLQGGGGGGGVREDRVHQLIWRVFTRSNGLTLKAEAVAYLRERLGGPGVLPDENELLAALSCIAAEYKRGAGRPALVDQRSLADVIEGMLGMSVDGEPPSGRGCGQGPVTGTGSGDGRPAARAYVQAVNAPTCPRWEYQAASRSFQHRPQTQQPAWLGGAQEKIGMFQRHFELVRQRVLRSAEFSGPKAIRVGPTPWHPVSLLAR